MTIYKVYWDNGAHACGTFPRVFDTEEAAQEWADNWAAARNAEDGLTKEQCENGEGYTAEVIEEEK